MSWMYLSDKKCALFACVVCAVTTGACGSQQTAPAHVDLPTSKQLVLPTPGGPQRINSLPMSMAVSPDGHYVLTINAGYGTLESGYEQSLSVLDTRTGKVTDFPDSRTLVEAHQTFFSGLAFSADGKHVYGSLASSSDPEGKEKGGSGSGIVVWAFTDGVLQSRRFLKLPLVELASGRTTLIRDAEGGHKGVPFPAAIAVIPHAAGAAEKLLVAENLSDTVAVVDATSGTVERRIDVAQQAVVPAAYPIALAVTQDGRRAFVALWNASEVVELDLASGTMLRKVQLLKPKSATLPGTHPCDLVLDEGHGMLYVALSNRDSVAAVGVGTKASPKLEVRGYFDTRLPRQTYFGAEPDALAINSDGSRLYAANMGTNSVAVLDTRRLKSMARAKGMVEPMGFIPTELMPTAMASVGGKLYIATDKGKGTGPNGMPQVQAETTSKMPRFRRPFTYAPTLLYGSLAALDEGAMEGQLPVLTEQVMESNRMRAAEERIAFAGGGNPIKHVIYIIKENRTYDQVLGDLAVAGKPVGNGDPSLTMYGAAVTPNQHKLALQFGVLDNFFDSGEVSGEGHVWSTAAIGTDYLEKTWQQNYRGGNRTYDYEGMVADGYPLLQHIPDVNEPQSGYLWGDLKTHGKTLLHFGEYISTSFCTDKKSMRKLMNPQEGAMTGDETACAKAAYAPGEPLPAEWGGGTNLWPWEIPRIARNTATKPELVGHFAEESPDFNLRVPDQIRVQIFLKHLEQWKRDLAAGRDTMPNFLMLRLPNDHTGGTVPGGPTPKASVADNDLAVGRAVEAVSHSAFWDNTAFFILEDDAQNGGDHVDAHRSLGIVVSKYAPHATAGIGAFVDSRFYSTVSVLRTMETLLGLPPMNNNDAFASMISTLFTGEGDQPSFSADVSNRDNGLIYAVNKASAKGAGESARMDFSHADRADARKLNAILWQDAMGDTRVPAMMTERHSRKKDDDD